ncbi:MAG: hypothetical protein WBA63_17090 [Thermomicrobiales bacterium]
MLIAIAFLAFFALIVAWIMAPSTTIDEAPVRQGAAPDALSPVVQAS